MAIVNNLIMQINGENIVVYPNTVGRAVYINESNGYNLIQALEDLRNNTISEWSDIRNKPFVSIGSDFKVIDGQLQLNGTLSMEWEDIQNKPSAFNTTWSRINDKPEYYPTEWNSIVNRPTDFESSWNEIQNKPDYFPTNWELVENRPENFASTWDDVENKPFNTLNDNCFYVNNGILSSYMLNSFNFIEQSTFNTTSIENDYYVVCNTNFNDLYNPEVVNPSLLILPYISNINIFNESLDSSFSGIDIIPNIVKYNRILNQLTTGNALGSNRNYYYFNENADYLMHNGKDLNLEESCLYNLSLIKSANYAFANTIVKNIDDFYFDNNVLSYNNCYHMFDNFNCMMAPSWERLVINFLNIKDFDLTEHYLFDNIKTNSLFRIGLHNDYTNISYNLYFNNVQVTNYEGMEINSSLSEVDFSNIYFNNTLVDNIQINAKSIVDLNVSFINSQDSAIKLNVRSDSGDLREFRLLGDHIVNSLNIWADNRANNIYIDLDEIYLLNNTSQVTFKVYGENNLYLFNSLNTNAENVYLDIQGYFKNCYLEKCFSGCKINNIIGISQVGPKYGSDNSITLNHTFENTTLVNSGMYSYYEVVNSYFNKIYLNYAFNNVNYLNNVRLPLNAIMAYYAFANCDNIVNAHLPWITSKMQNMEGCWSNCPNLTNITGGGDVYLGAVRGLGDLISMNYAFYGSNLLSDVEFNLYAMQQCNAANIFGGTESAYTANKRIHVLANSDLDTKSLTDPYFIENNVSLDASNITILENGRCFDDYHLYIYNDIESPAYFFSNIYGTVMYDNSELFEQINNTLIEDVIFAGTSFDNSDPNLIPLGAWDYVGRRDQMNTTTMSYFDNVNNIIYLVQNSEMTTKQPYYQYQFNEGRLTDMNIKQASFLNNIPPVSFRANKDYDIRYMFSNSKVTNAIDLSNVFRTLNMVDSSPINAYELYYNCQFLTDASKALDPRMSNLSEMFYNCTNLVSQYDSPINFIFNRTYYQMFNNCVSLEEPLIITSTDAGQGGISYAYMYHNCINLKNGYIGPDCNYAYKAFTNCQNMQNMIVNFSDINSAIYRYGMTSSQEEVFGSCYNLENFKVMVNSEANTPAPIGLFNGWSLFNNSPFLVYQPFLPLKSFSFTNFGSLKNCNNVVVMQIGNTLYWNRETGESYGMPSQQMNEINNYGYYGSTNNIAIGSIGNGYYPYGFQGIANIVLAAEPEYIVAGGSSPYQYTLWSDCYNLVFGRMRHADNVGGNLANYTNCYNLLLSEVSEDRVKYLIKSYRNDNSVIHSNIPINAYYCYNNCYNLIEVKLPKEVTNIYGSFINCYNLRYAQLGNTVLGEYTGIDSSFQNCYNLSAVLTGDYWRYIQNSFINCANLNNIMFSRNLNNIRWSFNNCGLENINFTEEDQTGLICIENSFCNSSKLQYVNVCTNVRAFMNNSFSYCNNITSVHVGSPNNYALPYMYNCFNNCPNLTNVIIENIQYINESFGECPNIRNLTYIGNSNNGYRILQVRGVSFWNSMNNITYLELQGSMNLAAYCFSGWSGDNFPPGFQTVYFNSNEIKFDGNSAQAIFANLHELREVRGEIPGFEYCYSLFANCYSLLEPANVRDNLAYNLAYAYVNCYNLRNAVCYDVTTNLYYTYSDCYNINEAVCGPNVIDLTYTYQNCINITNSVCGENVTYMYRAYAGCTNVRDVNIGKNVISFSSSYADCYNIPNNISVNALNANWDPFVEYRGDVNLDIHVYQNSNLYNQLVEGLPYYNVILNSPEVNESYNINAQLDEPNRRFYWEQPEVQLNIFYDLED